MTGSSSGDTAADLTFPDQVEAAFRNRKLISWLARWRARAGLSQAEIARRMHTSQPAVARLESHQHDPQLSTLARYAVALRLSIDFVVRDSQTHIQMWRSSDDLEPDDLQELPTANQPVRAGSIRSGANFWDALSPVERDALRSAASPRTFAPGAVLMREGERADHVVIILNGQVKICVDDDGAERIVAVRGPGDLVGERGVLQISVRSATVIALEQVQTLVVQTADFASFISAHPRVLEIVEDQIYSRLTEAPSSFGAKLSSGSQHGRPARASQPMMGENCTVVLSDVVGFGASSRTDNDRNVIREALYRMTYTVLEGLPDIWSWDDRGDGLLLVVPPSVPTGRVVGRLQWRLPSVLEEHNRVSGDSDRIKLRVAVDVGPVIIDDLGIAGETLVITSRMAGTPAFKKAMDRNTADLGLIASSFVYETVLRNYSNPAGSTDYAKVRVSEKNSKLTAWMKLINPPGTLTGPADRRAEPREGTLATAVEPRRAITNDELSGD
jgi:transcriptional regulator with XRE-family HTH domain